MYKDLGIEGRSGPPGGVGQMTANIDRALAVLSEEPARAMGGHANRIVIFSGLRVDREDQEAAPAAGADVAPRAAGAAGGSRKEGGRFPRDRGRGRPDRDPRGRRRGEEAGGESRWKDPPGHRQWRRRRRHSVPPGVRGTGDRNQDVPGAAEGPVPR